MPYVMTFNSAWCAPELAEIGRAMGLDGDRSLAEQASATIDAAEGLFASIGDRAQLLPADKAE
jgi:alcohol dehydrogenase